MTEEVIEETKDDFGVLLIAKVEADTELKEAGNVEELTILELVITELEETAGTISKKLFKGELTTETVRLTSNISLPITIELTPANSLESIYGEG